MATTYTDPAHLVPQGDTQEDATERLAVALWLVVSDDTGARRYAVDADGAWTHCNNPYDHASSAFETVTDSAHCWYEVRDDC